MYVNARTKLEDARHNLDQMRSANDSLAFKSEFNSFLGNCRSVTYALQKQGAKVEGFHKWYAQKQKEMKEDELLRFIHTARTEDFHEGTHRLNFSTKIAYLSNKNFKPPQQNAALIIGTEGPFWLINQNSPQERRVPVTQGSQHQISVSISNPPTTHLGSKIEKTDPITISENALSYMENLVFEAEQELKKKLT